MNFPTMFYNLRISRKLSQYEIAKMLGTSQASITAWERGARTPSKKMMKKISETFNIPMSSMISEEETDRERAEVVADMLHANPKLGLLFDRTRNMDDKDLDAILGIVAAITKENYGDDENK